MKKIFFIAATAFFVFSCSNDNIHKSNPVDSKVQPKEGEQRSKLSSGDLSEEELSRITEKRRSEAEEKEKIRLTTETTMEILPAVYDFGNVPKETPVTTKFTIKNTGNNPLIITDAKASCGCTVPKKPEAPILPGEEDELEITFTSNPGQAGTSFSKTVTVSANVAGESQTVSIKGFVNN